MVPPFQKWGYPTPLKLCLSGPTMSTICPQWTALQTDRQMDGQMTLFMMPKADCTAKRRGCIIFIMAE